MTNIAGIAAAAAAVIEPGAPDWDEARRAWNLAVDQRPAAIARPFDAAGVAAAVAEAIARGWRVAPQSTGHHAAPLGDLGDTLLLRTSALREVHVDAAARRVVVGGGALWQDVMDAASPHGLSALAGSSPDVGVAGYTLSGGIGWLSRPFGLASESVLAAHLVTAGGELLRVDARSDADLFWALRGGGGSFGVVTALELRLFETPAIYGGAMFWDWEHAGRVLRQWARWTESAPETATTAARILQLPPLPSVPAPLRGRRLVAIDGAVVGDEASGREAISALRRLRPEIDLFASLDPAALTRIHGDPEEPVPGLGDHTLLAALPEAAVDAFVEVAGPDSGSSLLSAELRHLGGALGTAPEGHGALGRIDADFSMYAVGVPAGAEAAAAVARDAAAIVAALEPWRAPSRYLNFTDKRVDVAAGFSADAYRRLRAVKARVDPRDVFRANHAITPAA